MKRMKTSNRFRIYKEGRRKLSLAYPDTFPRCGVRPPLKIGILKDIIADDKVDLSAGKLRVFLSVWTSSCAYLNGVSKQRWRVDLSGRPCAPVLEAHARDARSTLSKRRSERQKV